MKKLFALSLLAIAAADIAAPPARAASLFEMSLEDAKTGELPGGWTAAKTGTGSGSVWKVVADSDGKKVLAQTSDQGRDGLFNLCIADSTSFTNLEMSVKFKAVAGKLDQGGGLVWRYRDAGNYYIARMNPLEDNFRVYKVVAGKRIQLATADVKAAAGKWHTLRMVQQGDHIECYFNGKKYLDAKDDTFKTAGRIGLWSKADARTYFAELMASELARDSIGNDAPPDPIYEGKTLGEWIALTKASGTDVRMFAAVAIGNIGPDAKTAIPALTELFKDKDNVVRCLAAQAVGSIGSEAKAAIPSLMGLLKDEYARGHAAWALGNIGLEAKIATPALTELLKDKDEDVRRAAADALDKINPVLPPAPEAKTWKLVWHDEFDETKLDETKWTVPPDAPRKGGWWMRKAVALDGEGHLVISTLKDGDKVIDGCINTKGTFEHAFGYYVTRIKFQQQPGHWSAFWINGRGIGKVGSGGREGTEIDIMEKPWRDERVQHTLHWDGYGKDHKSLGKVAKVPGVMEGWHTFGLWWKPDEYIFYVDGKESWRTKASGVCQVPEYILLSDEIGKWGGDIKEAKLPDRFMVDYVRVYDLVEK